MSTGFSTWESWANRGNIAGLSYPGVYALAISPQIIIHTPFTFCKEIVYFGMTNAKGGLKSRLNQFDKTILGGNGHGGGHRVRFKHGQYTELTLSLFVSVRSWECEVTSNDPSDLRIMGDVVKYEYECFACFVEAFGYLPEFNDKRSLLSSKKACVFHC